MRPCELCSRSAFPIMRLVPWPASRPYLPRAAVKPCCAQPSEALGAYHAGLEWGFWAGPQECRGALSRAASVGDLLAQLQSTKVVRCDAAALRLLGLSLAGWNAVVSAGFAGLAVAGLRLKP